MKILVIGGSNSRNSINRKFAEFTASLFGSTSRELVDISQLAVPLYSVDRENENGFPDVVLEFANKIDNTDIIVLSLAENNGSYNAGFKNLMDWTSRIKNRKMWGNKAMLLLSTSPGARGGATVLEAAKSYFPYIGADIKGSFSLPKFYENFDSEKGITNPEWLQNLKNIVNSIKNA